MNNKKKKDLAKIALAAFMLSATLPAAGQASADAQSQGTLLAGGGCGASSSPHNTPASGSCGASQARRSPATSGCGASSSQGYAPASGGCGASSHSTNHAPATQGCGANYEDNIAAGAVKRKQRSEHHRGGGTGASRTGKLAMGDRPAEGMRPEDNMGYMNDSDASSYQGTTTGPGPNGGYPGAPHGSYDSKR